MRLALLALVGLLSGCERSSRRTPSPSPPAPVEPAWIEATLPCVVERAVEHVRTSRSPGDTFMLSAEVDQYSAPKGRRARWLAAFVDAVARAKLEAVSPAIAWSTGAVSLQTAGEVDHLSAFVARADEALGRAPEEERTDVSTSLAMVDARRGDAARALARVGDDPTGRLLVAEGLAQAGNVAAAREVVASTTIAEPTPIQAELRIRIAVATGDLEGARQAIAAEPDAVRRARMWASATHVVRHFARAPSPALAESAVAGVEQIAATASSEAAQLVAVLWSEVVWHLKRIAPDAASASSRRLADWILAASDPLVRDVANVELHRAAIVGDDALARRYEAALAPLLAPTRYHLAVTRGEWTTAVDLLADAWRTGAATRAHDAGVPEMMVDDFQAPEIDLWLMLPVDVEAAVAARFQALVCGR